MTRKALEGQALLLVRKAKKDGTSETESEACGRSVIDPAINAGLMVNPYSGHMPSAVTINASIEEVRRITNAVKAGDLSDLEGMLVGQAIALQTMAANFANRAQHQTAQRNLEAFVGMALKAQAQSRATISALVDLKYPRQVAFVKQANISNGPQQVNNGALANPDPERSAQAHAHGKRSGPEQIKILERSNGKWLDATTQSATSRTDQVLEAVGERDRPKIPRGKGQGVA